ncbi:lytic polysaccharide monooxygenase [Hyaloscypha bicolor E]|uniref:AA9 family lytic polysaccharide monooxygenase n=1 Tax=Hyaloscypha bicolor E TaxID=1095630 RepID=A0A2J6TPF3_9HELO|nr:lytic polysaccharide monooxygenase [Hyaloscypha bicolor E]PMD64890.1 lytic polysaccharide monooxygenase [Hyaloscypha bicolor E]
MDSYTKVRSSHSSLLNGGSPSVDEFNTCTRVPPSNSPVTTVTSGDIRCNVGGSKGVTGICAAPAGGNMTVEMHAQPGDRSFSNQAIEGNHFGPVIVYMSKVTDATTDPGSGSWLKADEEGYNSTTKKWGTDTLNSNCGHRSFTIPASISPGAYLSAGGAQLYMSCYQVNITGGGAASPAGVSFPGAYNATDPGILIDIYKPIIDYVIPGPAVFAE